MVNRDIDPAASLDSQLRTFIDAAIIPVLTRRFLRERQEHSDAPSNESDEIAIVESSHSV